MRYAVVRQGRLIAVAETFLIGCAVLLLAVGCSGPPSEAPKEKGRTQATNTHQGRTAEATAASEEARCERTRTIRINRYVRPVVTNDVFGCPNGGLLEGTDERDKLDGMDGEDEVYGLGARDLINGGPGGDMIYGGPGNDFLDGDHDDDVLHGGPDRDRVYGSSGDDMLYGDDTDKELLGGKGDDVLYGGPGDDHMLTGGPGEDALYGGDGNDSLDATYGDGQRDKLYCGKGKDEYSADKKDFVDSSCEKKVKALQMPV